MKPSLSGAPGLRSVFGTLAACAALMHCGSSEDDSAYSPSSGGQTGFDAGGSAGAAEAGCTAGELICENNAASECGSAKAPTDCSAENKICAPKLGCVTCMPGATTCDPQTGAASWCQEDGSAVVDFTCDQVQGMACESPPDGGSPACVGACSRALLGRTHVGCDFRPTVTANTVWQKWFSFGLVVTNQSESDASLVVTRGSETIATRTIPKESFETLELPWISELKGTDANDKGTVVPPDKGVLVGSGSYRLRSNQPVSVMQFSTLSAENPSGVGSGCPDPSSLGRCLSLSNDASLLLPANSLGTRYMVGGWHAWHSEGQSPLDMGDFVAITATRNATRVKVIAGPKTLTLAAPGMAPLEPGKMHEFEINEGDVLQLFTNGSSSDNQWAGSWIEADKPSQVISGAPCVNIPDDTAACDHIEEIVPPADTLGRDYLIAAPKTPGGSTRRLVRLHGIEDATLISFEPPQEHEAVTLSAGETLEVDSENDFKVSSTKAFGVTQFLVGHGGGSPPFDGTGVGDGDPSQTVSVPRSRYLKSYAFATPKGFDYVAVNVIAPTGAVVKLDSAALDTKTFTAIGSSGYSVARVTLEPGRRYSLVGDQPVSAQLFGYGMFTSFMSPLGMDLRPAAMR